MRYYNRVERRFCMGKEERKLTLQEEKRKEQFMKLQQEMLEKGYKNEDLTVGSFKVNVMALVIMLPIILLCLIIYRWFHAEAIISLDRLNNFEFICFIVLYIIIAVVHELIHGVTMASFCKKGWKAVGFGVIWKYLTPYCTCDEVLTYQQYKIVALMPTIILGSISYLLAFILGNEIILIFSLLVIVSGGGDIYIIRLIRDHKSALFIDHPYLVGCMAFKKAAI